MFKDCPGCRREILVDAVRCVHCDRRVGWAWRAASLVLVIAVAVAVGAAAAADGEEMLEARWALLGVSLVALAVGGYARSTAMAVVGLSAPLLLAGTALAWTSRHPESARLDAVADLPGIGPVVAILRSAFTAPVPIDRPPADSEELIVDLGGPLRPGDGTSAPIRLRDLPSGTPTDNGPEPASGPAGSTGTAIREPPLRTLALPTPPVELMVLEWVWALPGQPLSLEPDAPDHQPSPVLAYLPVVERRDTDLCVLHRGERRWLDRGWTPVLEKGAKRRRLYVPPVSSPSTLRLIRGLLSLDRGQEARLGPHPLLTDVSDPILLGLLGEALGHAEAAYSARLGRLPADKPLHTIALFSRQSDYQVLAASRQADMAWSAGHSGRRLIALHVEGKAPEEIAEALLHETAHQLNRRALAPVLPPWLEEGLASDVGRIWIEPLGPDGGLGRRTTPRPETLERRYLAGDHDPPPLTHLLQLDREAFYESGNRHLAYAESALFVEYLLDGEDGRLASGFRGFLREVAHGSPPEPQRLLDELGTSLRTLDAGFASWVHAEGDVALARLYASAVSGPSPDGR